MMALNASVVNFARGTLGAFTGVLANKYFVGLGKQDFEKKDFSKLQILIYIGFFSTFLEIIFIRLIPIKKDIEKWKEDLSISQDNFKEIDEDLDEGKKFFLCCGLELGFNILGCLILLGAIFNTIGLV